MGDWSSVPALGYIFGPWIFINESFPEDDNHSRDWLLGRYLIRMISNSVIWKSGDYKTRLSVKQSAA